MNRRLFMQQFGFGTMTAICVPSLSWGKALRKIAESDSEPSLAAAICIQYAGPPNVEENLKRPELFVIDFKTRKTKRITLLCAGHSAVQNPQKPGQFIVPAKLKSDLTFVDFEKNKAELIHPLDPKSVFYGHAAFASDGSRYFTTENNSENDSGVINERDAKTHQVLRSIPTHGYQPHQFLIEEDRHLIWAVNKGPAEKKSGSEKDPCPLPCLNLIDLRDGTLVRQTLFEWGAHPGHLVVNADRSVLVHGLIKNKDHDAPWIAEVDPEGKQQTFTPDNSLLGEALSVAIDNDSLLASVREGNTVFRWDRKKHQITERWNFVLPTGVLRWPNGEVWMTDNELSRIYIQKENSFESIHEELQNKNFGPHFTVVKSF